MKLMGVCVLVAAGCQFSTSSSRGGFGGGGGDSGASVPVTMPSLFQLTQADAEAALRRAGITAQLSLEGNNGACGSVVDGQVIELGHVCRQSPAAGQQTGSRLPVSVTVQQENPWHGELGGGRRWFLLPDLAGLTIDQAREKLRQLGFTASDHLQISYVDEPGCKPNIVCRTYPEPMNRTDNTSDKRLFAGRPAEAPVTTTPPPGGAKKPDLGDLF